MKSELEQERLQSAKLCRENETLRALNIECSRLASERSAKLTEMEQCLQWCSESVWSMIRPDSGTQGRWFVLMNDSSHHYAPTLYEALKSAWEARDHEA